MRAVEIDATDFDQQWGLTVDEDENERHTGASGGYPMTKEYLISANNIADMDRYLNEYQPGGAETLTKNDATPVVVTLEPAPVGGEWNDNHTFGAEFPSAAAVRA